MPLIFVLVCLLVLSLAFARFSQLVGREHLFFRWTILIVVSTALFSTGYYVVTGGNLTGYLILVNGCGLALLALIWVREKASGSNRFPVLLGLSVAIALLTLFG